MIATSSMDQNQRRVIIQRTGKRKKDSLLFKCKIWHSGHLHLQTQNTRISRVFSYILNTSTGVTGNQNSPRTEFSTRAISGPGSNPNTKVATAVSATVKFNGRGVTASPAPALIHINTITRK